MNPQVANILRLLLAMLGARLATKGLIEPGTETQFADYAVNAVGALAALASVFSAFKSVRRQGEQLNTALALPAYSTPYALKQAAAGVSSGVMDYLVGQAINTLLTSLGDERPLPPPELHEPGLDPPQPAMELAQWVKAVFLTEGGPLFQERHRHLMQADVACLWTNVEYVEGFMPVAATAELVRISGKPWQRMMTADHLCMLFIDTPRLQVKGIL